MPIPSGSMKSNWVARSLIGVSVIVTVAVVVYAVGKPDQSTVSPPAGNDPELGVSRAIRRFETASHILAQDYRDKEISAEEWLRSARDLIPDMVSAVNVMEAGIAHVTRGRERADVKKFVRISRDEVEALSELRAALADLDARNERHAWNHWRRASGRKFGFLTVYFGRVQGIQVDYGSLLPSIPLKSLAPD
jgi:hypothetical protein